VGINLKRLLSLDFISKSVSRKIFEIISEVDDGDARKPLIPGYSLSLLIISFFGVSVLLLRQSIKKLAKI